MPLAHEGAPDQHSAHLYIATAAQAASFQSLLQSLALVPCSSPSLYLSPYSRVLVSMMLILACRHGGGSAPGRGAGEWCAAAGL